MKEFNESAQVLDQRQSARDMINIWHGNPSNWINMIKELIGNSQDIFKKRGTKNNSIYINILDNKSIEYIDSGTGIPLEVEASDRNPNYVALLERAFAGTNYENKDTTIGQHGVFLYSLTMTCSEIEYFIGRPDGNIYNIAYKNGIRTKELNVIGKTDKTFSKIVFSLDEEVWENPNFTFENIKFIAEAQASLVDVTTTLEDKNKGLKETYYFEKGIADYFKFLQKMNNKNIISDNIRITTSTEQKLEAKNKIDTLTIDLILNMTNDSEDNIQKDFLNTADLIEHGTIKDGILEGLKISLHKYITDNGMYDKKEKAISINDVDNSLNFISVVYSFYPTYVGQTKQKSIQGHFKPAIKRVINEYLESYLIENPIQAKTICKQVLINKRANEKATSIRKSVQRELEEKPSSPTTRPDKFVPCRSKTPEEVELIIIEGDSALNAIKSSRNSKFQCIYPLKGKIINAVKNDLDDILKNNEVRDIFKILQCGMKYNNKNIKGIKPFNIDDLSVGKILITTDRDEDGGHIESLVIGLFYTLAPEIIKSGKLYVLYTPLYIIKTKKENIYLYTEEERNCKVKELEENNIKYEEVRYKGIGGLNSNDLNETAFSENRVMTQITWEDAEECEKVLKLCLSDEKSCERKDFIETEGYKYFDYSALED